MREYIHGFCNLDQKGVGIEEYSKGTAITCSQFKELFLECEPDTKIGDEEEFVIFHVAQEPIMDGYFSIVEDEVVKLGGHTDVA